MMQATDTPDVPSNAADLRVELNGIVLPIEALADAVQRALDEGDRDKACHLEYAVRNAVRAALPRVRDLADHCPNSIAPSDVYFALVMVGLVADTAANYTPASGLELNELELVCTLSACLSLMAHVHKIGAAPVEREAA